jgi:hypothetical protein
MAHIDYAYAMERNHYGQGVGCLTRLLVPLVVIVGLFAGIYGSVNNQPTASALPSPTPTATRARPTTPPPTVIAQAKSAAVTTPTPAPSLPTAAPPIPGAPDTTTQWVVVANTGGQGVYLRNTPVMSDRAVAWVEGTRLAIVGDDTIGEGRVWKRVRDPKGDVGWVPGEFVAPVAGE